MHHGGSSHPRHVHADSVASAVFYVRCPAGGGSICFFDPRGSIPPFEREIRHMPQVADLLIFPPWLSHAVSSGAQVLDLAIRTDCTSPHHAHPKPSPHCLPCNVVVQAASDGPRISISFNLVDDDLEEGGRRFVHALVDLLRH